MLWFRRKRYGWGWYPATRQGWMVIGIFLGLILTNSFWVDFNIHLVRFFLVTGFEVAVLIAICYAKGEKPRWQWGREE